MSKRHIATLVFFIALFLFILITGFSWVMVFLEGTPGKITKLERDCSFVQDSESVIIFSDSGLWSLSFNGEQKELLSSNISGKNYYDISLSDISSDSSLYLFNARVRRKMITQQILFNRESKRETVLYESTKYSSAIFSSDMKQIIITSKELFEGNCTTVKIYHLERELWDSTELDDAYSLDSLIDSTTVRISRFEKPYRYYYDFDIRSFELVLMDSLNVQEFRRDSKRDTLYPVIGNCDYSQHYISVTTKDTTYPLVTVKGYEPGVDEDYYHPDLDWQLLADSRKSGLFRFGDSIYVVDIESGKRALLMAGEKVLGVSPFFRL